MERVMTTYYTTIADWLANGPRLVQLQPIDRVVITDRVPERWFGVGKEEVTQCWGWSLDNSLIHRNGIPDAIFNELPSSLSGETATRVYFRLEDAMDFLGHACLLWALLNSPSRQEV